LNNDGKLIGRTGSQFITADSPAVAAWKIAPGTSHVNGGSMTVDKTGRVHVVSSDGLWRTSTRHFGKLEPLTTGVGEYFLDCKMGIDQTRIAHDGWLSVIGQTGQRVTVIDYWLGSKHSDEQNQDSTQ
jgi:hypothetical protein